MPKPRNKQPPRAPSLSQMERVREIHRAIQRFTEHPDNERLRVTDESLAYDLGVSTRQILRDRAVLGGLIDIRGTELADRDWQEPLVYCAKRRSWIYTRAVDLSPWVGRMNNEDLGALLVAQQALAVFSGMPLAKRVSDIFEQDAGGLVGNRRTRLRDDVTKLVSFHPDGAAKLDPETFATVFQALLFENQLEIRYRNKEGKEAKERTIYPYHLSCYRQQWRLIAFDPAKKDIRVFVVTPNRLQSVKRTGRTFKRPRDVDWAAQINGVPGPSDEFTLRISSQGMHFILERQWQELITLNRKEDHVIATFRVPESAQGEFERFVLAFGSDCEVIKPASFRRWHHEEARAMAAQSKSD